MRPYERMALGLLLAAVAAPVGAQAVPDTAAEARIGSRVRIMAPSIRRDRFIGRIDSLSDQRVVLDTTGERHRFGFEMGPVLVDEFRRTSVQRSAIERVEISCGRYTAISRSR